MSMFSRSRGLFACAVLATAVLATTASGTETKKSSGGASQGLGSSDATEDISGLQMLRDDATFVYAQVTIKNNSSKPSDYFVTVAAESPDGATRYDDTIVSVLALASGQTSTEKGIFTKDIPADAVLKLIEVQRTASN